MYEALFPSTLFGFSFSLCNAWITIVVVAYDYDIFRSISQHDSQLNHILEHVNLKLEQNH